MPVNVPNGEEVGWLAKGFAAVATFFATVFGIWKHTQRRIDKVHEELSEKADRVQVDRHHGAILDLYGKHDKVLDMLRDIERRHAERHVEILGAIHEVKR